MPEPDTVRVCGYDIPQTHAEEHSLAATHCPVCRTRGGWRRGVMFEHQMICMAHEPSCVWCPDDIDMARAALAKRMVGQGGDGI